MLVGSRLTSLLAALAVAATLGLAPARARAAGGPLQGRAMWVWVLHDVDDGNVSDIIAGAHRWGVTTLIVKSSDGTQLWPQFTPTLVSRMHRAGLRVCAWQYVYGNHPGVEARLGADAARDGADCLVIDAEVQYQGKYVAAQTYVHDLRRAVGPRYPLALAGLPYVDFHPGFPYSVFLGPGGAQVNMPQMYWRDIGASVADVFEHTYAFNAPYDRPIHPLGQLYENPPAGQIVRFRELADDYGAGGVSWWDWQDARLAGWRAISAGFHGLPVADADASMADVGQGAYGDLVVWLQEHLVSAGEDVGVNGGFGSHTVAAVQTFQTAHGLIPDGIVGPQTWAALLRYPPVTVRWVHHGRRIVAADAIAADAAAAATGARVGALTLPVPASASQHSRRQEIPGGLGAGGAPR